jgi:hypothetical protein
MGYTSEEVFGKCLEHFIPPDSLMANPFLNQLHSTKPQQQQQQQSRDSDLTNFNQNQRSETSYDALMSFYQQLQFQSSSPLPQLNHHHLVLKLQTSDQRVIPFSIHALPLYKRQERRLAADSVNGISDHLKSFIDESSLPYRQGEEGDLPSRTKSVAFYVVYMNHLTYDRSHFIDEQQQEREDKERAQSFVDRVLSVASSLSMNLGKSWMNTNGNGKNADATHYPSPPSTNPPESEEEKWGGFLL